METEASDAWEILADCLHAGKALRNPGQQLCHFFINHPKKQPRKDALFSGIGYFCT